MNRKIRSLKLFILLVVSALFFQTCTPVFAAAVKDTQPPAAPNGLTATYVTYTSILLEWKPAIDNLGVKGYHIYRDGKKMLTTSKTSYTGRSLVPGREYTFTVRAYDSAGNVSDYSTPLRIVTVKDTQAPSTPGTLTVLYTTCVSAAITWKPSADNTGIKTYEVYCDGRKKTSTSATYYLCKGLTPGKTYTFTVIARDIALNSSLASRPISAATIPDHTVPTVPEGLRTSSVTETEVNLTWYPASDNVKVKEYEIFSDGLKISTTSKTAYRHKGLAPGKGHSYTVRAIDSSGNRSVCSKPLYAATPKDLKAPTTPGGLKIKSIKKTTVSLEWKASTDNTKVKGYYVFCNGFKVATTTRTHCSVKNHFDSGLGIYYVRAYDMVDNLSASSNQIMVIAL